MAVFSKADVSNQFTSYVLALLTASNLLLLSQSAQAQSPIEEALFRASEFNAFIEHDFRPINYTSAEGKLLSGGDMHLHGHGTATQANASPLEYTVISGGNVYYDNGKLYSGSILAAGSASNISQSVRDGMQADAVVTEDAALPIDISASFNQLRQLSSTLSAQEANACQLC